MNDTAQRDPIGEQQPDRIGLLLAFLPLLAVLVAGIAYFGFLCDDAYISFRYSRNLMDGHGLVFNRG